MLSAIGPVPLGSGQKALKPTPVQVQAKDSSPLGIGSPICRFCATVSPSTPVLAMVTVYCTEPPGSRLLRLAVLVTWTEAGGRFSGIDKNTPQLAGTHVIGPIDEPTDPEYSTNGYWVALVTAATME